MRAIEDIFNSGDYLPVLPKVVLEVMQALDEESPNLKHMAIQINHDPVVAAKVLKLANSAHYGVQRHINTIEEAIALIGFSQLSILVITSAVTSTFTHVPNMNMRQFWRHSLVTASVAHVLALELSHTTKQYYSAEQAYLGGLFHNIGQLILHLFFPDASIVIERAAQASSALECKNIENKYLGVDHCQIGEELTKRWHFPIEIQQIVRHYADPMQPKAGKLAPIVYMAEHITFGMLNNHPTQAIMSAMQADIALLFANNEAQWKSKIKSYAIFLPEAEAFI